MTSALESLTLGVRDMDTALPPFRDILGFRIESDSRASVSLLGAWHHPVHAVVRLVELSCDGYPFGRIRLAHYAPPPSITTRDESETEGADRPADIGPKALEVLLGPPLDSTARKLTGAGWKVPERHRRNGERGTAALSLEGPAQVAVLLKAAQGTPALSARVTPASGRASEVSAVSVVVGDATASRRFYAEGLDLVVEETLTLTSEAERTAACSLFGFPLDSRLTLTSVRDRQQPSGRLLLLHLAGGPRRPLRHPMNPGQLGFNLFSLRSADLDALETRLRAIDAEIVTRPTHVAIGEGMPARLLLARGPDGELLEFVEREAWA